MEIGNQIVQLRKLSGMTQEQLAEKLDVSRQTISKWETGITTPDLESIAKISRMFQVSLDDLILQEKSDMSEKNEKITLEDLIKINRHNRRMTMLLTGGFMFLMMSVLSVVFINVIYSETTSIKYILYRYIAVGEYAYAPVDYGKLLIPSVVTGMIGIILCTMYVIGNHNRGKKN
uniref:helix-turn-helix domain-containing protein n=1 Tax=Acetatifactor sp. TaxID=1872090 RepID=UPI004055EE4A